MIRIVRVLERMTTEHRQTVTQKLVAELKAAAVIEDVTPATVAE